MSVRHLIAGASSSRSRSRAATGRAIAIGRPQIVAGVRLRRPPLRHRARVARLGAADRCRRASRRSLVGTIPIWMALFDRVAFGRRLPASAYVGIAVGFAGLAFLFDPFGEGSVDRLGALVIVVGAMCWAVGSLYSRGAPLPKRPLVSAGLASLCGGILLAGVLGRLGRDRRGRRGRRTRFSRSRTSSSSGASSASRPTCGCSASRRSRSSRRTRTSTRSSRSRSAG